MSTRVFLIYIYTHNTFCIRNSSLRNLHSTLYLIAIEIQFLITIETQYAEQKKN